MSEIIRRRKGNASFRSPAGAATVGVCTAFALCLLLAVPLTRGALSGKSAALLSKSCPFLGSCLSGALFVGKKESAILKPLLLILLPTLLLYLLPVLLLSNGAVPKSALPLLALKCGAGILTGSLFSGRKRSGGSGSKRKLGRSKR